MTSTKASSSFTPAQEAERFSSIGQIRNLLSSIATATWTGPDLSTHIALTSRGNEVVAPAHVRRYAEAARQVARLWSMEHVQEGWDGRSAKAPTRESLKAAHSLIDTISNNCLIPIPTASINSSGQSNLFWDFDGFYADVDVDEGKVEFFVKSSPSDEGQYYEEPLDTDIIPSTLLVALLQKAINAKTKSVP
jgi:hypothetical protein